MQFSEAVRNARADAVESTIGASAILKIRTGAKPANVAAADSGTVLATLNLPADWMAAAASGAKAMSGTWSDLNADAGGDAGHFRIYASDGTTCHIQGSITLAGDGGDMILNALTVTAGNSFTVLTFTITEGNG
jgi:hypothetical protein